eukprot:scaffold614884_cov15-Prasinocladus_malaysianus.AAC.1
MVAQSSAYIHSLPPPYSTDGSGATGSSLTRLYEFGMGSKQSHYSLDYGIILAAGCCVFCGGQ